MATAPKLALHTLPPECTVSSGTIEPSTQGGSMARRRYQCGCVILKGQVWYGKYRDDVVEQDGTVTRVQRRTPLGTKKEYPTKRLAERKLEQILCRPAPQHRSEEHTSELQSHSDLVCRLLLEKKK